MKNTIRFSLLATALLITLGVSLTAKTVSGPAHRITARVPATRCEVRPQPMESHWTGGFGR